MEVKRTMEVTVDLEELKRDLISCLSEVELAKFMAQLELQVASTTLAEMMIKHYEAVKLEIIADEADAGWDLSPEKLT